MSSHNEQLNVDLQSSTPIPSSQSSSSTTTTTAEPSPSTRINESTTKNTTIPNNDPFDRLSFKVGVAENKNITFRNKMEDVHTYIANFAERIDWGYFAIFDGHAGKDTARWCGNNLHTLLEQEIDKELNQIKSNENDETVYDMQESLYKSFLKADELIEKEGVGSSGSTAAVAVLRWETNDNKIIDQSQISISSSSSSKLNSQFDFIPTSNHKRMLYTSNVGDSRIVLCRNGQPYRLSYDHKATDINEINRIKDSNGLIMKNRVNGVLAVTRSLGDSYMKDLVIGKPFTTSTEITNEDDFLILACDGVWDVLSDLKACNFVKEQFMAKRLCQLAMDHSTTDNVTVMIVKFDKDIFNQ
ncbi:phosphatase 2C-like domain-containing protein [Scheffersomyces coipomensis]|uniref:phosphatase 2C-like domain-containing protein n=1 Tax=Scheffersomyces coipomensis TaxID=1788519 RepID=UPI00315C9D58